MIYRTNFKRKCSIEDINFSRMFLFAETKTLTTPVTPGTPNKVESGENTQKQSTVKDEKAPTTGNTVAYVDGSTGSYEQGITEEKARQSWNNQQTPASKTAPTTTTSQVLTKTQTPTGAAANGKNPEGMPGGPTPPSDGKIDSATRISTKDLVGEINKKTGINNGINPDGTVNKAVYDKSSPEEKAKLDQQAKALEASRDTVLNRASDQIATLKDKGLRAWWDSLDSAQKKGYIAAATFQGLPLVMYINSKRKASDAALWGGTGLAAGVAAMYTGNAWNADPNTHNLAAYQKAMAS